MSLQLCGDGVFTERWAIEQRGPILQPRLEVRLDLPLITRGAGLGTPSLTSHQHGGLVRLQQQRGAAPKVPVSHVPLRMTFWGPVCNRPGFPLQPLGILSCCQCPSFAGASALGTARAMTPTAGQASGQGGSGAWQTARPAAGEPVAAAALTVCCVTGLARKCVTSHLQ